MKKILEAEHKRKTTALLKNFSTMWLVGFLRVFFVGKHFITEIPRTVLLLAA